MNNASDTSYADLGLQLGAAIIMYAARAWIGPAADIGTSVLSMVNKKISSKLDQRRIERFFDECVDSVAQKSIEFLRSDGSHLSENELNATVIAVRDTFRHAELSDIIQHDLNASRFREHLEDIGRPIAMRALLDEAAMEFFRVLLSEAC